jgi:hypothetical protein
MLTPLGRRHGLKSLTPRRLCIILLLRAPYCFYLFVRGARNLVIITTTDGQPLVDGVKLAFLILVGMSTIAIDVMLCRVSDLRGGCGPHIKPPLQCPLQAFRASACSQNTERSGVRLMDRVV